MRILLRAVYALLLIGAPVMAVGAEQSPSSVALSQMMVANIQRTEKVFKDVPEVPKPPPLSETVETTNALVCPSLLGTQQEVTQFFLKEPSTWPLTSELKTPEQFDHCYVIHGQAPIALGEPVSYISVQISEKHVVQGSVYRGTYYFSGVEVRAFVVLQP